MRAPPPAAAPARSRSPVPSPSAGRRSPGAAAGRAGCPRRRAAPRPRTGCRSGPASPRSARPPRGAGPRASSMASSTLGPPGWQTHHSTSSRVSPCVGEEAVDVLAEVAPDQVGDVRVQHDPQAGRRRRPSPWCARSRGRGGCGSRAPSTPSGVRRGAVRARPRPRRPRRRRTARWRPGSGTEASSRCTVSEHSSAETSTATSSGWPTR